MAIVITVLFSSELWSYGMRSIVQNNVLHIKKSSEQLKNASLKDKGSIFWRMIYELSEILEVWLMKFLIVFIKKNNDGKILFIMNNNLVATYVYI